MKSNPMNVRIQGLHYAVGGNVVLNDLDLEVQSGEMFFLLGPSGCGKTTLIRLMAGFVEPDRGEIYLGDRRINGVSVQERQTALVFQNYALWPHLTVYQNVAFGLEQKRLAKGEIQSRTAEALRQVRMDSFADRTPAQLSGGQQQRVALARALVVRPKLLMLDEPLSNLDARLRLEMRDEILSLHQRAPVTSLYVTHDQEETLSMADRIAVMNLGKIEQVGTPREIYENPKTLFVASFLGEVNWYEGAKSPLARLLGAEGGEKVGFRPEQVKIVASGSGFPVVVEQVFYRGRENMIHARSVEGDPVKILTSGFFKKGETLDLDLDERSLFRF
jgi:ABC-type Fe3+/spermidine/putrescine transport system ATPase subunit